MVFDQSTTGTFSGNISGTGSLTKSGNGDVTLSGNNSYSGSTTINAGTLTLGSGNGIGSSSAVTIAGGTLAVGNQSQTVGTLSMSSGGLSIVSGNLTLGSGSSITGGTLSFDSAPAGRVNTNGTLTLGNSTFIYNHSVASTQGIVLSGNISVNSSATADFTNSGAGSGRITLGAAARVFDIGTSANMNVGWIIASTSTAGTLTKNGTGVLTLSGNNTYTGTTRINAGTLEITGSGRLGGGTYAAAISNNGSFIIGSNNNQTLSGIISGTGSLTKNGSGVLTLSGNSTYSGDTVINTGTLQIATTGRLGAGNYSGNITNTGDFVFGSTSNQTLSGIISGTGSLTKNGTGTLTISGNNSYTGTTTVRNGTITLAHANASGSGGEITFTGGGLQYGSGITTDISSRIKNSTATILIDTNGNNVSFDSAVDSTNTLGLTKNGTGTLSLTHINNYSGATVINAGILTISGSGQLGSGTYSGNISNAGGFVYSSSANQTLGGILSGVGSLTKSGASTLTLTGVNTSTGDISINAGTLAIGGTGQLGSGTYSGNISNAGEFKYESSANQTLNGIMSGNGGLTMDGAGILTLAGSNNYSGNTTINTGTVVIGNVNGAGSGRIVQTDGPSLLKIDTTGTIANNMSVYNVLASQSATLSGAITVNNATWDIETGDTLTISGVVSGNGGVTKNGGGTLTLNGTNTYNGSTIVNDGTLNAASANALGSNATVQVNGGSLLVSADNALNNKSVTLNSTSPTEAGLAFSGNYSGRVNNLTLSKNSIIDLGDGSVSIMFDTYVMSAFTLDIYNWTGTTLSNGGNGTTDTDNIYFGPDLSDAALANIRFHSGALGGGDSFLGSGFELMPRTTFDGGLGYHIIPVPEPETWATGIVLLLLGSAVWPMKRRRMLESGRQAPATVFLCVLGGAMRAATFLRPPFRARRTLGHDERRG
jgi:autotransporter-associated beta strand protein